MFSRWQDDTPDKANSSNLLNMATATNLANYSLAHDFTFDIISLQLRTNMYLALGSAKGENSESYPRF